MNEQTSLGERNEPERYSLKSRRPVDRQKLQDRAISGSSRANRVLPLSRLTIAIEQQW